MPEFYIGWTVNGTTKIEADDIFDAAEKAREAINLADAAGINYDVKNVPARQHFDFIGGDWRPADEPSP